MQLSLEHDFVAHAIAAKSARRLSMVTKNPSALHHAIWYRGQALSGLAAAVNSFSKKNADAILGASIILCDGEADWYVLLCDLDNFKVGADQNPGIGELGRA
jgi:hypothetical protein